MGTSKLIQRSLGMWLVIGGLVPFCCACSDEGTDEIPCGQVSCPADWHCVEDRCFQCLLPSDCPAGQTCFQDQCLDDCPESERCEWGGNCCPGGLFCSANQCVQCRSTADCLGGELVCRGGKCLQACPQADRCESGGDCCPGDWICQAGNCLPPCQGQRCGLNGEFCCQEDQVCQDDRCLIDCGQADRCGAGLDLCCRQDEVCFGTRCVVPAGACDNHAKCGTGHLCDLDLGICLPEEVIGDCQYHPPAGVFEPVEEWTWTGSTVEPDYDQVMMVPMVANLTDDNADGQVDEHDVPDVVFSTFHRDGDYNGRGVLRMISGDDGHAHWSHCCGSCPDDSHCFEVYPGSSPAIGDLDLDGVPEIVVDRKLGSYQAITGTYAFRADGSLFWEVMNLGCGLGGASIANLDEDVWPEVLLAEAVLSHDGTVQCTFPAGSNLPLAADVDLDGRLEIVSGRGVYRANDSGGPCSVVWELDSGGFPAVANFDADPFPEIVFEADGQLHLVEHNGTAIWSTPIPLDLPRIASEYGVTDCATSDHKACDPGGGPPTVADFDGDGQVEVGLAARWYYLVFDTDGSVLWAHRTRDFSSAKTGSSVFDFEGDGRAEVIYNDEEKLRVYLGAGGQDDADGDGFVDAHVLVELDNSSGTLLEYPLVVDVDADGRAEVLVAANDYYFASHKGLRVFGDALDNWVPTRRIWNQHAYHVTNVCDGMDDACPADRNQAGAIPADESRNWEMSWLNNFRQNVQGRGLFLVPDMVVLNLTVGCQIDLSIRVSFDAVNQGSRLIPASVPISIYVDDGLVSTLTTSRPLLPGQPEHMTLTWSLPDALHGVPFDVGVQADDTGDGSGIFNECDEGGEDNNQAELTGVVCGVEN